MSILPPNLQQLLAENEQLRREREQLELEKAQLQGSLEVMRLQNGLLLEKVDFLARRLFGKKSEQLSKDQLLLLFQEFEAPGPLLGKEFGLEKELALLSRPRRSKPRQKRQFDASHLPVIEKRIEPPQVMAHPEQWRCIAEEVSEKIDVEPARFYRVRTVRPVYVKKSEPELAPVSAPMPPALLERSIFTPGLLAFIIVNKYCDHLPLYRQEMILASRHGLVITRQTMVEWLSLAAYWLKPLYDMLSGQVFSSGYVQIDETPVRYLAPGNGKTKLGYFWVAREPKSDCVFHWEKSRSTASLEKLVPADFSGTIQCDGYEAYRRFAKTRAPGTIELVACMAHIRRDFVNAIPAFPRTAAFILCHIRNLYKIEEELREKKAGPELRKAVRNSSSRPIINRLEKAFELLSRSSQILPQSLMGKALAYARNQWPAMRNYLEDGRLEMDNNLVENSIRPTAVGKKNWLFIGHAEAGQTSAIIFTLIEACRKRGIDPFRYLSDIFTRLPTMTNWQIKEILPDAWLAARNRDQRVAA